MARTNASVFHDTREDTEDSTWRILSTARAGKFDMTYSMPINT